MRDRIITRPEGLDLDSPGRRDYWVALEHDSIWGDHLMPLTVLVGPEVEPQRGLVAFGANHGDEYEGPIAIKRLMSELALADVRGRIVLVPVLNMAAFLAGTRESRLDDRVNLNRAFVPLAGSGPGLAGITHRIAAFVRDFLWPRVDVVLDLHSGGNVARFALCTNYHPVDDAQQTAAIARTAEWFGLPVIMTYQNQTPGLLVSEAERLGKITVGTELGWGQAVNPLGVRCAAHGVRAAAIHHGYLRGSIEPIEHHRAGTQRRVAIVDRDCYTVAPLAGHYESVIDCGQLVTEGEVVGYLHDFDHIDMAPWPARAGTTGLVVAQAWLAPVARGQHIVVVGKPMD